MHRTRYYAIQTVARNTIGPSAYHRPAGPSSAPLRLRRLARVRSLLRRQGHQLFRHYRLAMRLTKIYQLRSKSDWAPAAKVK